MGEIYRVVGYSGAGKSTLIRCVNQLESVSAGQVIVDGKDLTALEPAELKLCGIQSYYQNQAVIQMQ